MMTAMDINITINKTKLAPLCIALFLVLDRLPEWKWKERFMTYLIGRSYTYHVGGAAEK